MQLLLIAEDNFPRKYYQTDTIRKEIIAFQVLIN